MSSVTLAIESAIAGGSLAVMRDNHEVAAWTSTSPAPKGEDLLINIETLLTSANLTIRDVQHVAVSAGPGSFTGIRIGLATALGLKNGLRILMSSASALMAMAVSQSGQHESVLAALPMGRRSICFQTFSMLNGTLVQVHDPRTAPEEQLSEIIAAAEAEICVLHSAVFQPLPGAIDFGVQVAAAVAAVCIETPGAIATPLFISKNF